MSATGPSEVDLGAWDALADRLGASPFHRPGWILAWGRAFGRGAPVLHTVTRDEELVGLAALERRRRRLRSAADLETPLFGILAQDEPAARDLARRALAERPRSVELWMVDPADTATETFAAELGGAGFRRVSRTILRSPRVPLEGGWEAYRAALGARRLRELDRRRRRLEDLGDLVLEVSDGSKDLERLLDEGFRVEGSAWKEDRGTSIAARPAARRFYVEVARWAADRGWLRLAHLRLAGRSIAFDLAFEWGGVHALLKTGFDTEFRRFAPGMLLRYRMMERAFAESLTLYDFLGTDDPWKRAWAGTVAERRLVQLFAPSPDGLVRWAAEAYGRPLGRRARRLLRRLRRR